MIQSMLVLMTASLHLLVMRVSMILAILTVSVHLPVNYGIHDPCDVGPDNGTPSLACE